MEYDTAVTLALEEFEKRHPRAAWPNWLSRCATVGGTKDKARRWLISITLVPKQELQPNEHWEEFKGSKILARVDPTTGEKRYVLHCSVSEVITVFEAVVDPETEEVTVLVDTDPSSLAGEELEGF